MFGFILFIVVLSFIGSLFSRPFYGYYRRPRIYRPFGGFGGWGWGMGPHYGYYRPWGYPFGGWGMMSDILAFRFIMRLIPIVLVISLISWALR